MSFGSTILLVDDTLLNLQLLRLFLSNSGYRTLECDHGREALKIAEAELPDLILLDVDMPDMDGYEVCYELKKNPATAEIPVLFISALGELTDKLQGFHVGGVDYITKPFSYGEVLARVRTHLQLRHLQQELAHKVAELERSNAELDAFAHTVAHDLKNPLAGLLLNADLVRRQTADTPKIHKQVKRVIEQGDKIQDILEGLLLLAGVRKKEAPLTPLAMEEIVQSAWQDLAPLREAASAHLELAPYWPVAQGYAPWVEAIWANYLSNALKHGGRPCHITLQTQTLPNGHIQFCVINNGNPVPEDKVDWLFTEFTQLPQVNNQRGHGLGLSIVKRIAERLGGTVGYHAHEAQACFYFTLPSAEDRDRS